MVALRHGSLDDYFSEFLAARSDLSGIAREDFRELVVRVVRALDEGHSCLPLSGEERTVLRTNPLVSDGAATPLVVYKQRLYLQRYFRYERRLAEQIKEMAAITFLPADDETLLSSYFPCLDAEIDRQKEAAELALRRALTILCGGPGTGKTTTIVKILAILLQTAGERPPTVALAAPTGKAAMRLNEAVGRSLNGLTLPERVRQAMPTTAFTLHRLLGARQGSPQFRHNRENPLAWDIIVVDEASMVDLAMMSKLVDAVKPGTRLILLGDKDQLASVESGAVLGDLLGSLPENTVELKKTYRFETGIKQLAEAVNAGDTAAAWDLLTLRQTVGVTLLSTGMIDFISNAYCPFLEAVQHSDKVDRREIFRLFNRFRVLCALHYGNRGVDFINLQVESALGRRGFPCRPGLWYAGRPVMINRNDYGLDLYNGDIGICLPNPENGHLQVWFERADGRMRCYLPSRLPSCETVFAMTIHKSQGSEFEEVLVVLPEEDHRILSRQLIYTAITRAKKVVRLTAEREVLCSALSRNIERVGGLADMLRTEGTAKRRGGGETIGKTVG